MHEPLTIGTSWWTLITDRAESTPGKVFLCDEPGRTLTFAQFRDRAEEAAAGLSALGVRPDHVVSWQLPTTLEAAVLMAALSRLGVRQNPIIPVLRRAEVSLITEQVDSRWLIVPGTYRGFDFAAMAIDAVGDGTCSIIDTSVYAADSVLGLPRGDAGMLAPVVDPGHTVRWYYYSSGTTASPKGAMHTDASVMAASNAQMAYTGMGDTDLLPVPFPITHIGGIMLLSTYLRVGASLLLLEGFDPIASPLVMAAAGATILGSATPFFHAYLAAQRRLGDEPLFPKLRQLQAGGAPVTPELNAECMRVFGTPIYNQWGLTEFPAASSLGVDDPAAKFRARLGAWPPDAA